MYRRTNPIVGIEMIRFAENVNPIKKVQKKEKTDKRIFGDHCPQEYTK